MFASGQRPDAAAIADLAAQADAGLPFAISHQPGPRAGWLELITTGLTFDCLGLAPGAAAKYPPKGTLLGLDIRPAGEAIALRPGPHLMAGRTLLPVVRGLVGLGAALASLPGAMAVSWRPAHSWMAPAYFRSVVADWLGGGAFPGLGLTTLHRLDDGAMVSHGLAYFTGQELRFEPGHGLEVTGIARIAVRLIHDLVGAVPLLDPIDLTGPGGERVRAEPRADGAMIRITVMP
ncbi:MAG: hypothetical protein RIQ99_899 [Pseudomonadota bacterium]